MTLARKEAIAGLKRIAGALGGLRWVQGAGGNASIKTADGELVIKASGKRLSEMADDDGHVVLPVGLARRTLDDSGAEAKLFSYVPRPSLETYFHTLGSRVVIHTHALGALLHGCAADTTDDTIDGRVLQVPYISPGRGLALAVRERLGQTGGADAEAVLLLRSHGLLVFAPDVDRAIVLTTAIDEALSCRLGDRMPIESHFAEILAAGAPLPIAGGVMRPIPARPHRGAFRYLFPDAVICCSVQPVDDATGRAASAIATESLGAFGRAGVLADRVGRRVAFARSERQLGHALEVLAAHEWVEDALSLGRVCQYLPDAEPATLLGMPAERYRIAHA